MYMRRLSILTFVAVFAMTFVGCTTTDNTNVKTNAVTNNNSNVAVVVNSSNTNAGVISTTNTSSSSNTSWNSNMSRTDYDKDRAKYEAQKGASTIGQGANDSWIWFKAKAALAASNDLRDSTINVDVNNDVITLKGTVANAAQKTAAIAAAKGIEGNKGVKDELKVQAGDSMTNQMSGSNSTTTNNANTKK